MNQENLEKKIFDQSNKFIDDICNPGSRINRMIINFVYVMFYALIIVVAFHLQVSFMMKVIGALVWLSIFAIAHIITYCQSLFHPGNVSRIQKKVKKRDEL